MQIFKLTISTSVDLLLRSKGIFSKYLVINSFHLEKNEEKYASESWFRCIDWQQPTILFANFKTFTKNRINQSKSGQKKKLHRIAKN